MSEVDDRNKRLLAANGALLKLYASLDPSDPNYEKQLTVAKGIHSVIVSDLEAAETTRANMEKEALDADTAEETARSNKAKERIDWLKVIVTGITGLASAITSVCMFRWATKKEEDESLLTVTNKTTVQNGLRQRFSDMFKFW